MSVLPLNHSTRWSATPSPSVSVSFQMLGGAATYSEPSNHIVPSGNIILSAKTVRLVELAVAVGVLEAHDAVRLLLELLLDLVVGARRVGDVQPALSSNAAVIGRSTSGGPAIRSIVNPSGTLIVRPSTLISPPWDSRAQSPRAPETRR